ncbi:beta-galactosidase [Bifidobacterium xylocopae]|uniref:beta-galactosidase n=1 Tax=Bifidobacterium xylocopae TaxID=2493119 RepID=A0A366KGC4_9BIFI|nr:beta-galactosidase [Bifidobacterium xylocopae]RBP99741.1 beta-galactosidase [Bifidobacterium xylocopae]
MKTRDHILFGAAYYDEYQPTTNLDEDMRLMREANMNLIRVGEGSWSHWEPEDGKFSLDWLQPVLDKAQENGIQAIIGMPTFAIPQWVVRKYPEIAITDGTDNVLPFGGREEHSYSHPVFRFLASRMMRKIVERYSNHPAVIGWQLHNEPGLHLNYSRDAFEGFKDYLRHRYGSVERLNKEWGLAYWSHELSTWDDLWQPQGNAQPQYDIEWRRYQAQLTDEMLTWQRELIQAHCRPDQFITVNFALGREAVDEGTASRQLDIAGSDPYYRMQDGLKYPDFDPAAGAWYASGPWSLALMADRTYSLKQEPFFVLETDGGPVGGSADNRPGYHGQWRQAAWQFISRGADLIEYWHWQQLHYGTETYWGGILPHDRNPGRVYEEIAQLGAELSRSGSRVTDLTPDADVAILYSVNSRWGLSYEPYMSADGTADPHMVRNPKAYDHLLEAFYQGAYAARRQVRMVQDIQLVDAGTGETVVDPESFAAKNPVFVVAGMYISTEAMLTWLKHYVLAGGHLILGPRSTYADWLARPRLDIKPSQISDMAKVSYQEFSNISAPLSVASVDSDFELRNGAAATEWVDCLRSEGARILARNSHPHFAQFPLITTENVDKGRLTVVGTVPNTELAASIFDYALPSNPWAYLPESVTHSSAVNSSGYRIHFLFNWDWQEQEVRLPVKCAELNGATNVGTVELGAWDVAVLQELGEPHDMRANNNEVAA